MLQALGPTADWAPSAMPTSIPCPCAAMTFVAKRNIKDGVAAIFVKKEDLPSDLTVTVESMELLQVSETGSLPGHGGGRVCVCQGQITQTIWITRQAWDALFRTSMGPSTSTNWTGTAHVSRGRAVVCCAGRRAVGGSIVAVHRPTSTLADPAIALCLLCSLQVVTPRPVFRAQVLNETTSLDLSTCGERTNWPNTLAVLDAELDPIAYACGEKRGG